jgi:squalene-associated FAD-dependent desaturase
MPEKVVIVGGGLAGLAATTVLAPRGFNVTLLESRGRLGGRAGSFVDPTTGELVDTCQHVSMGCCTNFTHFCCEVGIAQLLEAQRCLYFMTPDRRISTFSAAPLPAPLHLARSLWRAHFLTLGEKIRILWGMMALRWARADVDPPFETWAVRHGQTPQTLKRFWGLVLTSALNESTERIGRRYARKVFVQSFMRSRRGFEVEVPRVPLGRLYGEELRNWLESHHVQAQLNCAVKSICVAGNEIESLKLRDGSDCLADWYVLALPFDRLLELLPDRIVKAEPYFAKLRHLETSPITSVHLWYDRRVMDLPHIVLVDCAGQWVFNRGETSRGEHYVQVVVSASRQFRGLGHREVERMIVEEISRLFPLATSDCLRRARVITEHGATFSAVPGVDEWRPSQVSPIRNLLLAGDWTATEWPATMESAVRSGYLAGEAILERSGRPEKLVQPEL